MKKKNDKNKHKKIIMTVIVNIHNDNSHTKLDKPLSEKIILIVKNKSELINIIQNNFRYGIAGPCETWIDIINDTTEQEYLKMGFCHIKNILDCEVGLTIDDDELTGKRILTFEDVKINEEFLNKIFDEFHFSPNY